MKKSERKAKVIYVGTSEQIAKEAPRKGLEPPVILTSVYPGYFASQNQKWGIIQINLEVLSPDNLAPFKVSYKNWKNSLERCGICIYKLPVPYHAITKVTVYDTLARGCGNYLPEIIKTTNPTKITAASHQSAYKTNLMLTEWLSGGEIDFINEDERLGNRTGLELFYIRSDKDFYAWWKI